MKFDRLVDAVEHDQLDFEGAQARLQQRLEPLPFEGDNWRFFFNALWSEDDSDIDFYYQEVFRLTGGVQYKF